MNVQSLRFVGTLEGISFLLLLGIAMPIKYIWGINFRKIRWDGAWCFIHTLFSDALCCLSSYEMVIIGF